MVAAALLATIAAAAYAAGHARFDTDRENMLSQELPFRKRFAEYQAEFPRLKDNLVVVVDADTPERADAAADALARRLRAAPGVFESVDVPKRDPFLLEHGLLFLGVTDLEVLTDRLAELQPLLGTLARDPTLPGVWAMLARAREAGPDTAALDLAPTLSKITQAVQAALADRPYALSWREIMAGRPAHLDDRRQFLFAKPRLDYGQLLAAAPAMETIRRSTRALGLGPGTPVAVHATGGLAMAHEELQTLRSGAALVGILSVLSVAAVLAWGLRSLRLVAFTFLTLVCGLTLTAAFAFWAVGHLNLISIAFCVLYVGLGVDFAIHLCLRYRELRRGGAENRAAVRSAVSNVGGSLALCAATTAVGFYAFWPTDYTGVSELGVISGTGMGISLLVSLTLLPALLTLFPLPRRAGQKPAAVGPVRRALHRFPIRRRRWVLAATGLLALASLAALPRVRFDANPVHLRDPASDSVRTYDELLRTSETPPLNLTVVAPDAGSAAGLAARLRGLPTVGSVVSLGRFVPADQELKSELVADLALVLGPDLNPQVPRPAPPARPAPTVRLAATRTLSAALERAPPAPEGQAGAWRALERALRDLVAAAEMRPAVLGTLERSLLGSLPATFHRLRTSLAAEPYTTEDLPRSITDRWVGTHGTYRLQVFPAERLDRAARIRRFVDEVRAAAPNATAGAVLMLASGDAVVRAFQQALAVALAASFLVMLALLRSLRDTLLALTPVLLAAALTAGAMALLSIPWNFANVIALPLLMGIGVDSGIHIVHRARAQGGPAGPTLGTSTARAVVFSALTTACSFGNLALSPHPGTASMGLVLTIGIAATLACTLVVLPSLLSFRSVWGRSDRATPGERSRAAAPHAEGLEARSPDTEPAARIVCADAGAGVR